MCEQEATAIGHIGVGAAEVLKKRLSDICAADCVHDVLAGRPRTVRVNSVECYAFDLADHYVLTVTANHARPRTTTNGQTDWSRVRRIKVTSVEK